MAETYIVAPSILGADFSRLGEAIRESEDSGADWIHIDVMDGEFVPNISMGPVVVEACRRVTKLPLDVHLMIIKPSRHIQSFAEAGADSITLHVEASRHLHRTLSTIRDLGLRAGVALNPATPATSLTEILHLLDLILVMTVNPGFGGQSFIESSLPKIREVRQMIESSESAARIQVDGGISSATVPLAASAGADVFVAGNSIFSHPDGIAAGIEEIRTALLHAPA